MFCGIIAANCGPVPSLQYGSSWVDVAAPGVAILSTMPDTPVYLNTVYGYYTRYDALTSISVAMPHVAGLAGLGEWEVLYRSLCT